jgi:hypothetical protein
MFNRETRPGALHRLSAEALAFNRRQFQAAGVGRPCQVAPASR